MAKCGLFLADAEQIGRVDAVPECMLDNPSPEDCKQCFKERKVTFKTKEVKQP